MPVITCPDCGRDVSTLATACPHCGRPSPAGTTPIAAAPAAVAEQTLWTGTPSRTLLAGHFAGIVVVAIGLPVLTHVLGGVSDNGEDVIRFGWIATAVLLALQIIALA